MPGLIHIYCGGGKGIIYHMLSGQRNLYGKASRPQMYLCVRAKQSIRANIRYITVIIFIFSKRERLFSIDFLYCRKHIVIAV